MEPPADCRCMLTYSLSRNRAFQDIVHKLFCADIDHAFGLNTDGTTDKLQAHRSLRPQPRCTFLRTLPRSSVDRRSPATVGAQASVAATPVNCAVAHEDPTIVRLSTGSLKIIKRLGEPPECIGLAPPSPARPLAQPCAAWLGLARTRGRHHPPHPPA